MRPSSPSMKLEVRSAHVPGDDNEHLPLTALSEEEPHVHGELEWTVGSRRVPRMGFWGPDDVCLGEWWDELTRAIGALSAGQPYTIDSCEQGDPAFRFERRGPSVHLSIVAGLGGGGPNPEWQHVEFGWDDMQVAVQSFKQDLAQQLQREGPAVLPADWVARLSAPA